jgi:hypothetical protein
MSKALSSFIKDADLDAEMTKAICTDITGGLPPNRAAALQGVNQKTWDRWLRWGKEEPAALDDKEIYRTLVAAVAEAESKHIKATVAKQKENEKGVILEDEIHQDVVAYNIHEWTDEHGKRHKERKPVKMTLVRTVRRTERNMKAPEWTLERRDPKNYAEHKSLDVRNLTDDQILAALDEQAEDEDLDEIEAGEGSEAAGADQPDDDTGTA